MASSKHLKILMKGVTAWNHWREHNLNIQPNLGNADLSVTDLPGANFSGVGFGEADLRAADLSGANLSGAGLSRANMSNADLRRANLSGAYLNRVDLTEANLIEADLTDSVVSYTIFGNVDLSDVKGLEHVKHEGPSIIGIDTIYRSKGKISEIFLRRAGVPENFIAYMHSLAGTAFDFYSCFISYSSKDQEFADRLYADLQVNGVRCWLATEDLKIGDPFRQVIDEAIRHYDKLLVVLSKTSVASTWVESEVEAGLERERRSKGKVVLFPVRLDETVMKTKKAWAADIRRKRHMGDFSCWQGHASYQKAFQRLLRDLKGVKAGEGGRERRKVKERS